VWRRLHSFWLGEVDLAPVAFFRMLLGVLLFNYFWQLYPNLDAFFTDDGILPRSVLFAHWIDRPTVLALFGEWWQVVPIWLFSLVVATTLAIGFRSRVSAALAFLALCAIQWRDPLIADGSDYVYRLSAFWLIFSGAGDRFSLDAALRRARGDVVTGRGPAFPVRILEFQIALIYLFTALEKLPGHTWTNGTAIYYALQLDHTWSRSFAIPLAQNMAISSVLTYGTLAIELAFLALVFFPLANRYTRLLAVAGGAALQGGIATLMNVGNFPLVMLAGLVLYLPPAWITRALAAPRRLFGHALAELYYDGACAFCVRTIRTLRGLDAYRTVTFVDFRTAAALPPTLRGHELEKRVGAIGGRGQPAYGVLALAVVGRGIPILWPLAVAARVPVLSSLLAAGYDAVAARRWLLLECPGGACSGHDEESREGMPEPHRRGVRYAALGLTAVAAFATAVPPHLTTYRLPEPVSRAVIFAGLDQRWNMFSPDPPSVDGWIQVAGKQLDGTVIDMNTGKPFVDEPRYNYIFGSRWAKVDYIVTFNGYTDFRTQYALAFCRLRNFHPVAGQLPVTVVQLLYTETFVPAPGAKAIPPVQYVLLTVDCPLTRSIP
jgi:predicted DCC family thiol-disulfide oxidoreductase YuxK